MSRVRFYAAVAIVAAVLVVAFVRSVTGGSADPAAAPASPAPTAAATAASDPASPAPTAAATRAPATTTPAARVPQPTRAPAYQPARAPRWDDPRDIASRFTAATCGYSWRTPYPAHLAAQSAYASTNLRRMLAAGGAAAWQANVVNARQVSTCTFVDARVIAEAPNDARTQYVRVTADVARAPEGTRAQPTRTDFPLVLTSAAGRWYVDGYTQGG